MTKKEERIKFYKEWAKACRDEAKRHEVTTEEPGSYKDWKRGHETGVAQILGHLIWLIENDFLIVPD